MAKKYGELAKKKVKKAMQEFKKGELKSSSGDKVKSKKQAIAIGLSEARAEGGKVPKKKTTSSKQRPAAKRKTSGRKKSKSKASKSK